MTRQLTWTPRGQPPQDVEVEIGEPEPEGDGRTWWCRLTIRGFPAAYSERMPGADPLHALLHAVWTAPIVLRCLAGKGRVQWGRMDPGFLPPPGWGHGRVRRWLASLWRRIAG